MKNTLADGFRSLWLATGGVRHVQRLIKLENLILQPSFAENNESWIRPHLYMAQNSEKI